MKHDPLHRITDPARLRKRIEILSKLPRSRERDAMIEWQRRELQRLTGQRNPLRSRRAAPSRNPDPVFAAIVRWATEEWRRGRRGRSTYLSEYASHVYGHPKEPIPSVHGISEAEAAALRRRIDRMIPKRDRKSVAGNPRRRRAAPHRGGRRSNPPRTPGGATLIYPDGKLSGWWYGRHRNGRLYKHHFTHAHAAIYGLPDGSIRIKPSRGRLWRNFEVPR